MLSDRYVKNICVVERAFVIGQIIEFEREKEREETGNKKKFTGGETVLPLSPSLSHHHLLSSERQLNNFFAALIRVSN